MSFVIANLVSKLLLAVPWEVLMRKNYANQSKNYRERSLRVTKLCPAKIKMGNLSRSALCVDFSTGGLGLLVESLNTPVLKEKIEVEVGLPGQKAISFFGEVAHVGAKRPDKIGIRFVTGLNKEAERTLRDVVFKSA